MLEERAIAGRFELIRHAGSGGMGDVYEAHDRDGGARVALKILTRTGKMEEARFAREAQALERLTHKGVVRYIAHGTAPRGELYLAMEWVDGETLGARLRRGPLSITDSVSLIARLADALAAVHQAGIVHRDLKPSNILLEGGSIEEPRIVDFGLARLPGAGRVTCTGTTLGTPGYMAPEQARGEADVDSRADVFALGCVLFRCLTGVDAFDGQDALQSLLRLVLEEAPRAGMLRAEIPGALDALVARMLSKSRDERPSDGHEVAVEIERLGGPPRSSPPSSLRPPPSSQEITSSERRVTTLILVRDPRVDLDPTRVLGEPSSSVAAEGRARRIDELREVASRHLGRIEILADDVLVVVLSSAAAPTDLAARAARCALAMRAALDGALIAVATGWAELQGRLPAGALIEHAMLLIEGAVARGAAGLIVVDEVTARLLGQRFEVSTDAGRHELGGERAGDEPAPPLLGRAAPFVGRDRELSLLESTASQCVEDSLAAVILITGRAGSGKSRLRQELGRRLRASGVPHEVWIGHGDPLSAGAPFGLIARAIRGALGIREGQSAASARARIEAAAAELCEPVRAAAFLGEALGAPAAGPSEDPQLKAARREPLLMGDQLRRTMEELLRARCERQMVILVLEDLQWGDLPTVTFVDSALRNLSALPLLVIALGRPEVTTQFPRLWGDRGVQMLQLGGLPRRAAERFARQALGPAAPAQEIDALVERADGNPFCLEELIRAVTEGKRDGFPETLLAMAEARIAGLEPESRRILRAASIFGHTFSAAGVEALLGGQPMTFRLADLVERELLSRPSLAERGGIAPESAHDGAPRGHSELHFRHALLREAAYGMLTDGDRAIGHLLAGHWLEAAGRGDALTKAEHFERGGEPLRAAQWYQRAAEEALQGNDLAAALKRAERGAACGATGEVLGEIRRIEADAHTWRGELVQAEERASEAIDLLQRGSVSWYRALTSAVVTSFRRGALDRLKRWTHEAETATAVAGAQSAQAYCLAFTAGTYGWGGRYAELDALLAKASEVARESPDIDDRAWGVLHQTRGARAVSRSEIDVALGEMQEAMAAFERAGDLRNACAARMNVGYLNAELGDMAAAVEALRAALAEAERMDAQQLVADILQNLGYALAQAGQLEEARAVEELAVAACRRQGQRRSEGCAHSYLARIMLLRGDAPGAEQCAREAAALLQVAPPLRAAALALLSRALLAQGRVAEALAPAVEAFNYLEAHGALEEGEALVRLSHAEALLANARSAEAARVLRAARGRLLERAARIHDDRWRQRFLMNVPDHAETLAKSGHHAAALQA